MTHTFRIEGDTWTMTSEPRLDGSTLEIVCRAEDGTDTRLRLQFTREGFERFTELVTRFERAARANSSPAAAPIGAAAAAPTSAAASASQSQHVARYGVVLLEEGAIERLRAVLTAASTRVAGAQGAERVVAWQASPASAGDPDEGGVRVYLSAGALQAARQAGLELQPHGEVSRQELPRERELLAGDAPLDWQDTAF